MKEVTKRLCDIVLKKMTNDKRVPKHTDAYLCPVTGSIVIPHGKAAALLLLGHKMTLHVKDTSKPKGKQRIGTVTLNK